MAERSQPIVRGGGPPTHPPLLIEACRRGDRDALQTVFTAEAPALERTLACLLNARADVEDVLQATFLAAISAFPRFRGEASVRTWLTKIGVRIALAELRKPAREIRGPTLVSIHHSEEPDEVLVQRSRLERIEHHLAKIGAKKRVAFLLHVFEGRSIAEVAALVGATEAATKSRIFWARKELLRRAKLDPVLEEMLHEQEAAR